MYARIVKLTFMNDFSKEATSSLLVELGKTNKYLHCRLNCRL